MAGYWWGAGYAKQSQFGGLVYASAVARGCVGRGGCSGETGCGGWGQSHDGRRLPDGAGLGQRGLAFTGLKIAKKKWNRGLFSGILYADKDAERPGKG